MLQRGWLVLDVFVKIQRHLKKLRSERGVGQAVLKLYGTQKLRLFLPLPPRLVDLLLLKHLCNNNININDVDASLTICTRTLSLLGHYLTLSGLLPYS